MTLRDAIVQVGPKEYKNMWVEALENSKHVAALDRDFAQISPREISKFRDEVGGIGRSFVERLLDLKFNIERDGSGPK